MSRTRDRREFDKVDRLKKENQQLKRQLARLRKVLDRIDVERFNNLKEIVDKQRKEDEDFHNKEIQSVLERKWECHNCRDDVLRIIIVDRRDGVFYFRRCNSCGNRTKMQKYHDKVEGPK